MNVGLQQTGQRTTPSAAPPELGITPVPVPQRQLDFGDYFVFWLDLGVGLLVILAGALLAPLGLRAALLAIVLGTLVGTLLLALAGLIGSRTGVPTMPLLRPVLGLRGSYLPSVLNVIQLVGWTAFELWAMGYAADRLAQRLFGFSTPLVWIGLFGLICILLTLGGPLVVIRRWLKKFGVWLVLVTSIWITIYLLSHFDFGHLLARAGDGRLPFWVGVDLVIAMPISWLPLVADYSRFARHARPAFWGTYLGYLVANIWFYSLGLVLILTSVLGTDQLSATGVAVAISGVTAGFVSLAVILVDEIDNAFADLYSAAVSTQNVFPKLRQRPLIIALGGLSILLAAVLDMSQFANFLLLMGALFVPLFGLLAADYFVVRRQHYDVPALYAPGGAYWFASGLNWLALLAWIGGIGIFNVTNPTLLTAFLPAWGTFVPAWLTSIGGSLPGFAAAFFLYWLFSRLAPTETRL